MGFPSCGHREVGVPAVFRSFAIEEDDEILSVIGDIKRYSRGISGLPLPTLLKSIEEQTGKIVYAAVGNDVWVEGREGG